MLTVPPGTRLIVKDTFANASLATGLQRHDLSRHKLSYLASPGEKILLFAFANPALGKGDVVYSDELEPLIIPNNYNYFVYRPQRPMAIGADVNAKGYKPDVFINPEDIMREVRRSCGEPAP